MNSLKGSMASPWTLQILTNTMLLTTEKRNWAASDAGYPSLQIFFFFFLRGNYESKLLLITSRNKSCIFFGKEQHSLILMYSEYM